MIGAIIGDICGSPYEWFPEKDKSAIQMIHPKSKFTDDSVCTIAITRWLQGDGDLARTMKDLCIKHLERGYGLDFLHWVIEDKPEPYGSWGNGAAMRVSTVPYFATSIAHAADLAKQSADITHNHWEGVRGAQATAVAGRMALEGWTKAEIKNAISRIYGYDLERTPDEVRERYYFEVSCQKTVPEAIICFLHCENYEDTIKTAISLGGDADTVACIAGGIAGAYYQKIPGHLYKLINEKLTPDLMEDVRWFEHEYARRTYERTSPDALATWIEPEKPAYNPAAGEHEKYMAEMDKIEGFLATQRPAQKPIWTRWAGLLRRTLRI